MKYSQFTIAMSMLWRKYKIYLICKLKKRGEGSNIDRGIDARNINLKIMNRKKLLKEAKV